MMPTSCLLANLIASAISLGMCSGMATTRTESAGVAPPTQAISCRYLPAKGLFAMIWAWSDLTVCSVIGFGFSSSRLREVKLRTVSSAPGRDAAPAAARQRLRTLVDIPSILLELTASVRNSSPSIVPPSPFGTSRRSSRCSALMAVSRAEGELG